MMEPYDNKSKKLEKKILLMMKKFEQKVDRSDFEMMIIKKVDRDDVNEMIGSLQGGGEEITIVRREIIKNTKKLK